MGGRLDDTAGGQQTCHTLGRLRAALQPVANALFFDDECRRVREWVVVAQIFEKRPIPRRRRFGDDKTISRLFLSARTAEPQLQQLT